MDYNFFGSRLKRSSDIGFNFIQLTSRTDIAGRKDGLTGLIWNGLKPAALSEESVLFAVLHS